MKLKITELRCLPGRSWTGPRDLARHATYALTEAEVGTAGDPPALTGIGGEPQAVHLALIASGDAVRDWLHAGQALSAVLLTAAAHGLTAAIEDLAEAPGARAMLHTLTAPEGQPQILIRVTAMTPTGDDDRRRH